MIATLLPLRLAFQVGSPLAPALSPLVEIRKAVLKSVRRIGADAPAWRQSQDSWNTAWGQDAFGIDESQGEAFRYRFRVPPDADGAKAAGKTPFLVEAYEGGFPTYGIRQNGEAELARPLGFRYGHDGLCNNVSIRVVRGGRWVAVRLSKRELTGLGKMLALNEFTVGIPPISARSRFGEPWIRIAAEGYGDYWIARNLECVGPFGASCRLIPEVEPNLRELIGEPKTS